MHVKLCPNGRNNFQHCLELFIHQMPDVLRSCMEMDAANLEIGMEAECTGSLSLH